MRPPCSAAATALAALLFGVVVPAQTIGIDDLSPDGVLTAIEFSGLAAETSLCIYSASALRERGLCGSSALIEVAVVPVASPTGALSGTYSAPQALLQIGHVVSAPQVGGWSANLIAPITIHGLGSGTYSFPWVANTFVPLPGFAGAGFVWDGVSDVGILFSAPAVPSGGFLARGCSQRRHRATGFPPPISGAVPNPGALKVRLSFTPGPACGTSTSFGLGCYRDAASFYEVFQNLAAFDLAGSATTTTALRATLAGSTYTVAAAPGAWQQPSGLPLWGNGTVAQMTDDSFSLPLPLPFSFPFPGGSTNVIHASANGFVLLGPTAEALSDPTPTVPEILTGQPRLYPMWTDLDPLPASTRGVYYDIDPSGQAAYVTWNDCLDGRAVAGGPPTSITLQCVLRSSGAFEFRYRGVSVDPTAVGRALVGWSRAADAVDPGLTDLSQATPFATMWPEAQPLALTANAPALGVSWRLTIQPTPPLVPSALLFFGTGSLPGPDLGAVGAPGCRAYTTADITSVSVSAIPGVATATAIIPMNPLLLGVSLTAQAGAFTFRNPLGLLTSNGMQFVVGY